MDFEELLGLSLDEMTEVPAEDPILLKRLEGVRQAIREAGGDPDRDDQTRVLYDRDSGRVRALLMLDGEARSGEWCCRDVRDSLLALTQQVNAWAQ